jgi:hypothetical protein
MTTTQRVNLVRNAEEHIRALTAVIDLCPHIPGTNDGSWYGLVATYRPSMIELRDARCRHQRRHDRLVANGGQRQSLADFQMERGLRRRARLYIMAHRKRGHDQAEARAVKLPS